ncbi:Glucose-methanol-choline oxidoreductase, C-terminal,Glucose-methanol-choline oxidoreductase, N- [Cinara cedri]|uniref:Glucose-methanol-choline oxidoreductase, C-terminal,Glucose-methanol-choline oxidoreductase, N n=1 Tax=Cinara cedri TaxID=506608 RepID=A0A5E4MU96_9HEMI|nr:Glucose-methanol-choline oxidoreductase, C-terminal,Glucose-methanol-choline oxidoreductase, N- [Cinara cedri]
MTHPKIFLALSFVLLETFAIQYPYDFAPQLHSGTYSTKFDFIVVGAGSAGAIVATRLSEIPEWNVLLLEAGGDPPDTSVVPLTWTSILKTEYDWEFVSEPQPHMFKGLKDGRSQMPMGRMLGGTSSMNTMLYIRGTEFDYNNWATMGCSGWDFDSVLPYFRKLETFADAARYDPRYHGDSGPMTISQYQVPDPALPVIARADEAMGVTNVTDLNRAGRTVGYAVADSTTRDGQRCSTLAAYLIPNSGRPNLFVAKNTTVTRVLIGDDLRAYGVEILTSSGQLRNVVCQSEVIVSAGPVKSAQLLMLSGIGPASHLMQTDIAPVVDLPVGYNLLNHVSYFGLVLSDRKYRDAADIDKDDQTLIADTYGLITKGLPTIGLTGLISFFDTTHTFANPDVEMVQIRYECNTTAKKGTFQRNFGFSDEMAAMYDELNSHSDLLVMLPISLVNNPGRVELTSNNPLAKPKIFTNYLTTEVEYDALIKAIELTVELCTTQPMIDAGFAIEKIVFPDCPDLSWGTPEYWRCGIQYVANNLYHTAGTNRMGPAYDPNTVVTTDLRVKGVNGLRVIDSSVMPSLVACSNAATMVIAEKGSDMIKMDHGKIDGVTELF